MLSENKKAGSGCDPAFFIQKRHRLDDTRQRVQHRFVRGSISKTINRQIIKEKNSTLSFAVEPAASSASSRMGG